VVECQILQRDPLSSIQHDLGVESFRGIRLRALAEQSLARVPSRAVSPIACHKGLIYTGFHQQG
jgi:hypothetical protein